VKGYEIQEVYMNYIQSNKSKEESYCINSPFLNTPFKLSTNLIEGSYKF